MDKDQFPTPDDADSIEPDHDEDENAEAVVPEDMLGGDEE